MKKLRASAVPLVSVDPYFNIWSFADNLYDDATRHWTGRRNSMSLFLRIDRKWYKVMGGVQTDNYRYFTEPVIIKQQDCVTEATKTAYLFENELVSVKLFFRTPLLPDNLIMMSGPVSYISYETEFKDGKTHDLEIYFDICSEICTDDVTSSIEFGKTDYSIYCGKKEQNILGSSGDDKLIEWGYLHLIAPGASCRAYTSFDKREIFKWDNRQDGIKHETVTGVDNPVLSAWRKFGEVSKASDFICVAYDDVYSIEYFGEKLESYRKKSGLSFEETVRKYVDEYETINKKCDEFDRVMRSEGNKISSEYADLICLAYRQVIAAHKLVEKDGKPFLFSKECCSNGCIGTVDVTYPSIPVFFLYNHELAKGLLNPVFDYVMGDHGWEHEFSPHDIGIYPKANGQVYGHEKDEPGYFLSRQMPVEECGNMLICTAAICKVQGNAGYAEDKMNVLEKWANYLVRMGFDPDNQLCTDDFAGHLAHNCNLSVKGIIGIASYGYILNMLGRDGDKYLKTAKDYAEKWEKNAFDVDHYRLAFDMENSWSLKYNLVWDKIFGFGLFNKNVFETEVNYYKTKFNKYGVPLDSRKGYTKTDWEMWTTCLADDKDYRDSIIGSMWQFMNDTNYRVPFPDWIETENTDSHEFQNRTVQGGLFMPLFFRKTVYSG